MEFSHAAHPSWARADFSSDELAFAQALNKTEDGTWMRNPSTAELGFSIPLPIKVGDSTRFFPDFLWWIKDTYWAIDTTGRHLLRTRSAGSSSALITLVSRWSFKPD